MLLEPPLLQDIGILCNLRFAKSKITEEYAMPMENFIITVHCLVDEALKNILRDQKLRQRSFSPSLPNSEMITMEVIAEFSGIDTDKGAWKYFSYHWQSWFLLLGSRANNELKQCAQIDLQAAVRSNMTETRSEKFIGWLKSTRRLVETVIGQLTARFQIEKIRAHKLWYLTNRIARKVLAHTVCVFINKQIGNPPLQFELLMAV